ncbi:MAG: hypothetical protein ACREOO_05300 [bacterium]
MIWMLVTSLLGIVCGAVTLWRMRQSKPWLLQYFRYKFAHPRLRVKAGAPTHIVFLYVDHFEPKENTHDVSMQAARMRQWLEHYPAMASRHRDADGCPPKHSWFYLVEDWETEKDDLTFLKQLAHLSYDGFGEVDLHVHHGRGWHIFPEIDTAEKLAQQIERLKRLYRQTGALITAAPAPQSFYGFIHGKWALDNSAHGLYCGVDQELEILRRTGCYADFTMPSGHGSTQSRKINSIYYAATRKRNNKNHDWGEEVRAGDATVKDERRLMILQGMIEVYARNFILGKSIVEKSNLDFHDLPSPERIDQWIRCNVHVAGRRDWVFVKVHTHGAREENFEVCFGEHADMMHAYLEERYNDGNRFKLHYVSAREAYNLVKAAEAGMAGDPHQYRDFLIPPYANLRVKTDALYELRTFTPKLIELDILDNLATTHAFEFKHPAVRKIEVQGVRNFSFETGSRSRFRLQHEGAPQVTLAAGHHILALQTSTHGVARLVRTDLRSGKESEETFLITDGELQVEFAAAPASLAREHA